MDMTQTQQANTPESNESNTASQRPQDPRPAFARATDLAATVLAQVRPHNLRNQSPCDDFDAGGVASHMVGGLIKIEFMARGVDPFTPIPEAEGLEPDGFVGAWETALERQRKTWSDDAILGSMVVLPFGTLPGAVALAIYVSEVLVHTWDLAQALGIEVDWPQDLVAATLATMQFGLPAEPRGGEIPFGPVVELAEDSAPIHKLVAWLGRDPR